VLSLGFIGRRLGDGTMNGWLGNVDPNNGCANPHPNAIIRLQRVSDRVANAGGGTFCGSNNLTRIITGGNPGRRYWPNVLYDAREGAPRDSIAANTLPMRYSGVMHYVEFDVNNFRRWLRGDIGVSGSVGCVNGAGGANCPMDVTGFVVYFSDRRTNRNFGADGVAEASAYTVANGDVYADDRETGEFGWEDNINPGSALSDPNGALDSPFEDVQGNDRFAEDLNANDVLDNYGGAPRLLPPAVGMGPWPAGWQVAPTAACTTPAGGVYSLWDPLQAVEPDVAQSNRAFFFRRALKLVNGGRGNLPANGTQGLTVTAENPVYVQGNYNACTNVTWNGANPACVGAGFGNQPAVDHVSAAIIADAVTFLSNRWNDIRSFNQPYNVVPHRDHRRQGAQLRSPGQQRRRSHRLRHRRRRPQLHPLHRGLGRPDAELPRLAHQLLHQPPGGRALQVLRQRLLAAEPRLQLRHRLPHAGAAAAAHADVPRPEHADVQADPAADAVRVVRDGVPS
jgi:hypothetical protein